MAGALTGPLTRERPGLACRRPAAHSGRVTDDTMPEPQPTDDLEYDLAHETDVRQVAPESVVEAVYVPTQTVDYDGDYGYDLAHDVPGR